MAEWLFEQINRVPKISNKQIAAMRHIEPVLKTENSCMYRRIKDADKLAPRTQSFLWDAQPVGEEFTFNTLNISRIITQHHCGCFFKPSLAEVYVWILVYMPKTWQAVRYFHIDGYGNIGSSSDHWAYCDVMGGKLLERGEKIRFVNQR